MKIRCINTPSGLVPIDDDSFSEKLRLKQGRIYSCEVKEERNYKFLKKAYALLNAAWALLDERQVAFFRSKDGFRDYLTVTAGHYELYYNQRLQAWCEQPASWSFGKMDESAFNDLYERMKDVIYSVLGDKVTEETFNRVLSNF